MLGVLVFVILVCFVVCMFWPLFVINHNDKKVRNRMTQNHMMQKEFDELVEKLLNCPSMYKGLVFMEIKHAQPFLKKEFEETLKQYLNVKEE